MFLEKLIQYIHENSSNYYTDNFNFRRFGEPERDIINSHESYEKIFPYLHDLSKFYNLLADEASKVLLIQLTAFRILGHRKVRLPLSIPEYWRAAENTDNAFDKHNGIDMGLNGWQVYYCNLSYCNRPIELYSSVVGILNSFFLKQYEYQKNRDSIIKVQKGDVVLDLGGCWGDTALSFAHEVGVDGKVFSCEFIPNNIKIFNRNLELNPDLSNRIKLITKPIWEKTGLIMYYKDSGPGSNVSFDKIDNYSGITESISIDDMFELEKMTKVDFIKMDIEGAEPYALRGATETINKFKPKLAISIYHNLDDYARIIHYINGLGLGYKFYLGHFTTHHEETVLYCEVQQN